MQSQYSWMCRCAQRVPIGGMVVVALAAGVSLGWVSTALGSEAEQVQKLTAFDRAPGDFYGSDVAVSGEWMVVGSTWDDPRGTNSGSVYVYRFDDGVWRFAQKLTAGDGGPDDRFGQAATINGTTIAVPAPHEDSRASNAGAVYLFELDDGAWVFAQKIVATDGASGDRLGWDDVALDGTTMVVGAHGDDDAGQDSGSAYVFVREEDGVWAQQMKLRAPDAVRGDEFGRFVAVSGERALIGAFQDAVLGVDTGSAYVFRREGIAWVFEQKLTASDGLSGDGFGRSVALDGDTALIGAPFEHPLNFGSAYVFERDDALPSGMSWMETQKLVASPRRTQEWFGTAGDIDGDVIVVGGRQLAASPPNPGKAWIFKPAEDRWGVCDILTADDGASGDNFGGDVMVDGRWVVIGATSDDAPFTDSGSAYVFDRGVLCAGDITGDGATTTSDLTVLLGAFGSVAGDAAFQPGADFNGDDAITTTDLTFLLGDFGCLN